MSKLLCTTCQATIPLGSSCSGESHSLNSRVVELRTCNVAPLDSETGHIRSSLANAQPRLQYVQNSIKKFEESLESLRAEQQSLGDYIHDATIVLHPIRRVPTETLLRIFRLCVERIDTENLCRNQPSDFSSLDIKGMRWVLGYVCHRWRDVMLSSPQLWTDVELELGDGRLSWRTFLLGIYIGRSQSLPLSISLSARNSHLNGTNAYLSVLSPSAHRWRLLFLAGINPCDIQTCFCSTKTLLSSLQTLSISDCHWDGHSLSKQCDVFQALPALREVIFRKVPSEVLSFRIPFRQLSTLELEVIDSLNISQLLDCLRQTQNLDKLVVECASFTGAQDVSQGASLSLPFLRHLEIRRPSSMAVSQQDSADQLLALDLLSLPRLNVLHVHNALTNFHSIKSLIFRSCCAMLMTELSTDAKISEDSFIHLISSYPSLTSIDLGNVQDLTGRAIRELVIQDDCDPYLPKLDTIRLRGDLCFDANKFVDMIASRWKANSDGKDVARPRMIELAPELPPHDSHNFRCTLNRFDKGDFRGLQWKLFEYQPIVNVDTVPRKTASTNKSGKKRGVAW